MDSAQVILIVFLMSAAPLVEIWLAIPAGIALGLDPGVTMVVAVLGNFAPLPLIVVAYRRGARWLQGRGIGEAEGEGRRFSRFRRIWRRHGMPIASLLAPVTVGMHLALAMTLVLGSEAKRTLAWMGMSLLPA